jgi:Uma2 family endonuclease
VKSDGEVIFFADVSLVVKPTLKKSTAIVKIVHLFFEVCSSTKSIRFVKLEEYKTFGLDQVIFVHQDKMKVKTTYQRGYKTGWFNQFYKSDTVQGESTWAEIFTNK